MPKYRILPGGNFRLPDGALATAGAEIDLGDDVAAMHPALVQRLPDPPADPAPPDAEPIPA